MVRLTVDWDVKPQTKQTKQCLLSHLPMYLVSYIGNNMDPDQTAPKGAVEQSDQGS